MAIEVDIPKSSRMQDLDGTQSVRDIFPMEGKEEKRRRI